MKQFRGIFSNRVVVSVLIGVTFFLAIYGFKVLDVTYDAWIFNGYIEKDIIQHYSGWMIFRDSPWSFPLGLAQNMAYPIGGIITYTDSIPLVSIFFKVFRSILPSTFQYFGWYVLTSFVLQAIASSKLIGVFTKDKWINAFGTALFVLSPVLIERSFRHTSLSSQYLILFAWYLYFSSRKDGFKKISYFFLILNVLAISIHPYFVLMVSGLFGANLLGSLKKNKKIVPILKHLVLNLVALGFVGYVLGVFIPDVSEQSVGFGTFAMNLNALINPLSLGVTAWSKFIKQYPQAWGNYDGFNYLGFGVLFFYLFMLISEIVRWVDKDKTINLIETFRGVFSWLINRIEILLVSLFFFLFAISNVIKYGTHIIVRYELPDFAMKFANIFRASSRLFYPVFYLIFLTLLVWIIKRYSSRIARVLVLILLIIQIVDISPVLIEKHRIFYSEKTEFYNLFTDGDWTFYAQEYDYAMLLENDTDYDLAAYIGKSNLVSNIYFLNRGASKEVSDGYLEYFQQIKNGIVSNPKMFFITSNQARYDYLSKHIDTTKYEAKDYGTYKVFLPKK